MNNNPQFLLINKPAGWTSFDAVNFIRKNLIAQGAAKNIRVGHSGTLDPFATGLLIVGVGREATKQLDEFKNLPKTYEAEIFLGAISDTGDSTGVIVPTPDCEPKLVSGSLDNNGTQKPLQPYDQRLLRLARNDIATTLKSFIGRQLQIPPMYSAKKNNGKKLYELARQGKTVERQPCEIEIYQIKLLDYNYPRLKISVDCSAGTYIRTLAHDLGQKLGVGGYCQELCRTKIGEYKLEEAREIKTLKH